MKTVYYELYHVYENEAKDDDIWKFIGLFSSVSKAKEAVEYLRYKPGFIDYPKKDFEICKVYLNLCDWEEGFCSWEEAYEYQKQLYGGNDE